MVAPRASGRSKSAQRIVAGMGSNGSLGLGCYRRDVPKRRAALEPRVGQRLDVGLNRARSIFEVDALIGRRLRPEDPRLPLHPDANRTTL
jgi:hypothetical protein